MRGGTVKKIAFLSPRPDLGPAAFQAYWRDIHGPLVAGSPGYAAWRSRYVQNHIVARGPIGEAPGFAGMAAFWLPGAGPNEDDYAKTSIYRDRIRPDELNFIDMDRTVSLSAVEQIVVDGAGAFKLVVLAGRLPTLPIDDFGSILSVETEALTGVDGLCGCTLSHTIAGSERLPGARPADGLGIDCLLEFWFGGPEEAAAWLALPTGRAVLDTIAEMSNPASLRSFLAEELIFFDGIPLSVQSR